MLKYVSDSYPAECGILKSSTWQSKQASKLRKDRDYSCFDGPCDFDFEVARINNNSVMEIGEGSVDGEDCTPPLLPKHHETSVTSEEKDQTESGIVSSSTMFIALSERHTLLHAL